MFNFLFFQKFEYCAIQFVKAMAEVDRNIPEVGMRFKTPDDGWLFWVAYGGRSGFDVRKRGSNVSKMDGKVTSCRYVCSNEGVRTKKQTEDVRKCFRAETRTGCKARMVIVLDRGAGNYEVTDIVLEHNHPLHIPETFHLMRSQRRISELQAFEIETADDSGIRPKAAHELATRQVGGPLNLSYTCRDRKNYLQSKRQRELAFGQAGSMLKYFHDKIVENPSFQYALQPDCEDHITNIFWADAKMVLDYAHFGDVVTFDTTFGTNKEYRPFGVFLGLNQFRETTIFGAALLFDETEASFTWLFDTFLAAHNGKQPRTIYTDQDAAMAKAIKIVFTESYHGLCTFHIMQNAVKHLSPIKGEEEDEAEEKEEGVEKEEGDEESHILYDFSACMFAHEDEASFEETFQIMRTKVHKQTWLDSIYKVKEKWAECYMRDVFTLGVRSTQLSESFNNALKNHLRSDFDIIRFLKHFERSVQEKRNKELESEFEARKKLPRRLMCTPMLVQASEVYTPAIFEAFQGEYERSMAACARVLDGKHKYAVAVGNLLGDR
jgi:zinc finger SWIM domain-containing protein 3